MTWSLVNSYLYVSYCFCGFFVFFFKQKTAYGMRISDWSSDVCSSDLMQFCDFALVQQQFPGAFGFMIIAVAMTELGDIAVDQPDLIPFHLGIAFRDRAFPEAQRFYFRARQHYASFVHIVDGIVIARAPVLSDG